MKCDAKVSICIPTYKQPDYLRRLLSSILEQTHKNVQVIVSDDTPDDSMKNVTSEFERLLPIQYYQHIPPLKTPRNWNFALDQASGDFLMLMHQDDWFAADNAIECYLQAFKENAEVDFIYSRNTMILNDNSEQKIKRDYALIKNLDKRADLLPLSYVVGPPSNVMVRKSVKTRYDNEFIWLVDVDYCVRTINAGHKTHYIDKHLVSIGMHEAQTTVFCYNNPEIILRENILYANKMTSDRFKPIRLYDYFWRLLRNHKIRNEEDIFRVGVSSERLHNVLRSMLSFQKYFPLYLLKNGFVSKALMSFHYLIFRIKLR